LSRTGFGGARLRAALTDPADAEEIWNAIIGAGATGFGAEAIEILRVEAGLIVTDYDYEAHQRSPYDFNLDRMIAIDKDVEFLGKERLREEASDPANRFVTLRYEADELPEYGATVSKAGEEIGVLTSPTDSPRFGKIGLAVIRTDRSTLGNSVQVRRRRHGRRDRRRLADLRHEQGPALLLDFRRRRHRVDEPGRSPRS
jgi:aminomethyltransferase